MLTALNRNDGSFRTIRGTRFVVVCFEDEGLARPCEGICFSGRYCELFGTHHDRRLKARLSAVNLGEGNNGF